MDHNRDSLCFFWDIQNCPVPSKGSPYECVTQIRSAVATGGERTAEVGFFAYCDVSTLSQDTRQELSRARVHVRDVPSQKKGAADMCLQQDILRHTMTHRSGIIVLISGDVDFAEMVHDLVRMGNYRVVLIHNKQARPELRKNASQALKFDDVLAGGLSAERKPPRDDGGGKSIPKDDSQSKGGTKPKDQSKGYAKEKDTSKAKKSNANDEVDKNDKSDKVGKSSIANEKSEAKAKSGGDSNVKGKGDGNKAKEGDGKGQPKEKRGGSSGAKSDTAAKLKKEKSKGDGKGKPREKSSTASGPKSDNAAKPKNDKSGKGKPRGEEGKSRSKDNVKAKGGGGSGDKNTSGQQQQRRKQRQRLWSCPDCEKTFAAEESLAQHVEMTGHTASWDCEECGKTFQSEIAMQQHKDATGHDKIVCDDCEKEFASEMSLAQHLDSTGHCANLMWMCPRCDGESWSSLRELLVHLKELDADESDSDGDGDSDSDDSDRDVIDDGPQVGTTAYYQKWCHQYGQRIEGASELYNQAIAGNADALYKMASCFATGVFRTKGGGGEVLQREALIWGLLAAQRGHAEAQLMVGRQYLRGEGAPKNLAEAERWLSLAAQQGQERAQAILEVVQREKLGV